jgi:hypothetical protein
MRVPFYLLLIVLLWSCTGQEIPEKDYQIRTATLPAPEHLRAEATIMGWDAHEQVITLREGSNHIICLADNPLKDGYNASAYHKDLEAFMKRGRALRKEGKSREEIFKIRGEEVQSGKLNMPDRATLYVSSGKYNVESGVVEDLYTRYVIYIPYATEASTGMPLSPSAPGSPWIMDPGTHRAHIMINPPKN